MTLRVQISFHCDDCSTYLQSERGKKSWNSEKKSNQKQTHWKTPQAFRGENHRCLFVSPWISIDIAPSGLFYIFYKINIISLSTLRQCNMRIPMSTQAYVRIYCTFCTFCTSRRFVLSLLVGFHFVVPFLCCHAIVQVFVCAVCHWAERRFTKPMSAFRHAHTTQEKS